MSFQRDLCKVFCDSISVSPVPAGLAVSTAFEGAIGDRISFYIVRDQASDLYRIEDDGALVPELMAMGVNIKEGQRARIFDSILGQSHVSFDEESGELKSALLRHDELANAALQFVAMLIRVGGLITTTPEAVKNTFRDDAIARIQEILGDRIEVRLDEPVSARLADFVPDVLLLASDAVPVAVFVGMHDARLYEAIFLRMAADHEAHERCSVVALIDRDRSKLISSRMRQRAQNRLDAVPIFYGSEVEAVEHIASQLPRGAARFQ